MKELQMAIETKRTGKTKLSIFSVNALIASLCLVSAGQVSAGAYEDLITSEPSLLSYHRFEGFSAADGDIAIDSSGNFNNGVYSSTTIDTDGIVGKAIDFRGSDFSNVEVAGANGESDFDLIGTSFTLEAWVKTTADVSEGEWWGIQTKGDGQWRTARHGSDGPIQPNFAMNGVAGELDKANINIADGVWHHIVAVFDDVADTKDLYLDGNLIATQTELTGTLNDSSFLYQIGNNSQNTNRNFEGSIDEAAVYTSALSGSTILAHYELGLIGGSDDSVLGDVNGDMIVDLEDYYILRDNMGKINQTVEDGDVTLDGIINLKDFAVIRDQFEVHNGGQTLASAIPEPVSLLLLSFGTLAFLKRTK